MTLHFHTKADIGKQDAKPKKYAMSNIKPISMPIKLLQNTNHDNFVIIN